MRIDTAWRSQRLAPQWHQHLADRTNPYEEEDSREIVRPEQPTSASYVASCTATLVGWRVMRWRPTHCGVASRFDVPS